MRRERGERLLNALLIADVRQNVVENRNFAAIRRGDHQAAHGHQRQKARRFQRDGLAAGVRAGDDERIKITAEVQIGRHDLIFIDERVARRFDGDAPLLIELRHGRLHFVGELPFCENEIQLHRRAVALDDAVRKLADLTGKLRQDAVDLVFFVRAQHADFVVRLHNADRLNKHGGTAAGGIVNEALDFIAELRLNRHNVAAAALGNNSLLQILLVGLRADHFIKLLAHAQRCRADLATDSRQGDACGIGNFFLADDGHRDAIFDKLVRLQGLEAVIERRFDAFAFFTPIRNTADGTQCRGNRQ